MTSRRSYGVIALATTVGDPSVLSASAGGGSAGRLSVVVDVCFVEFVIRGVDGGLRTGSTVSKEETPVSCN